VTQLEVYEVRISDDARFSAGAFRTGAHDDLATALGLACLFESDEGRIVRVPSPYR
jgi:hypothetical protein